MTNDLVQQLRKANADIVECDEGAESGQCRLMREAADELDILQRENAALKETQEQMLLEMAALQAELDHTVASHAVEPKACNCVSFWEFSGHAPNCPMHSSEKPKVLPDLTAGIVGREVTPELEAEFKRRVEEAGFTYGGVWQPGEAFKVEPDATLVLRITTAYEQGFGQAGRQLDNPYRDPPEREAWNIGYQQALKKSTVK